MVRVVCVTGAVSMGFNIAKYFRDGNALANISSHLAEVVRVSLSLSRLLCPDS